MCLMISGAVLPEERCQTRICSNDGSVCWAVKVGSLLLGQNNLVAQGGAQPSGIFSIRNAPRQGLRQQVLLVWPWLGRCYIPLVLKHRRNGGCPAFSVAKRYGAKVILSPMRAQIWPR